MRIDPGLKRWLVLIEGEIVKAAFNVYRDPKIPGYLVLTNYRIMFLRKMKHRFELIHAISHDELQKLRVDNLFAPKFLEINQVKFIPRRTSAVFMRQTIESEVNKSQGMDFERIKDQISKIPFTVSIPSVAREVQEEISQEGEGQKTNPVHIFFDLIAACFAIALAIVGIVSLGQWFIVSWFSILPLVIGILGIIFTSFIYFDRRDVKVWEVETQIPVDLKRLKLLIYSIITVVLYLVGNFLMGIFIVYIWPISFSLPFFLIFDIFNLGTAWGLGLSLLGFGFAMYVAFNFNSLYVRQPSFLATTEEFFTAKKFHGSESAFFPNYKGILIAFAIIYFLVNFISIFDIPSILTAFLPVIGLPASYILVGFHWIAIIILWFVLPIVGIVLLAINLVRDVIFFFSSVIPSVDKVLVDDTPVTPQPEEGKKKFPFQGIGERISDAVQRAVRKVEEKAKRLEQKFAVSESAATPPSPPTPPPPPVPASAPPVETPSETTTRVMKNVDVQRGGQISGKEYLYKIKITNNTEFIINDVRAIVTSFPSDSLAIESEMEKRNKIEPSGDFVSVSFHFRPTSDCVQGKINAMVTYLDAKGESNQVTVPPHEIRMICGLLSPVKVNAEEFDKITKGLLDYEKAGEEISLPLNCEKMYKKTLVVLPKNNFDIINTELVEVGDNKIALIKGFAKGKYSGNKVGLMITLTGEKESTKCMAKIDAFTQDKDMLVPLLSEISQDLTALSCNQCGATLTPDQAKLLAQGKSISCKYCGETITRKA